MTEPNYYSRQSTTHIDGTPIFQSNEDMRAEERVARALTVAWNVTMKHFGKLAPLDWYCMRDERLAGIAELKHRPHSQVKYPTVFLNVRKWLALMLAQVGMGVPAVFVVEFNDGIRWIRVSDIDARTVKIGGCNRQVKSKSDVEPVIEVPINQMEELK